MNPTPAASDHTGPAAALELSEERFGLLVASVQDYAIFMLDTTGHVASWNLGAQRIKGYRADEILGRHFSVFYTPQDREDGKPARVLAEASAAGRWEGEGWRVRRDGSWFWANVVVTALRRPDGELVGFAKVTRDLTERRRAEQERLQLAQAEAARIAAEAAGARLTLLNDAAALLASSLDYEETLPQVARRLVPEFADLCRVEILDPSGVAHPLATVGRDPALEMAATELGASYPRDPSKPSPAGFTLTLAARGQRFGAMTFGRAPGGEQFSPQDLALAQELTSRAAIAIDNAQLYRRAIEALQAREEFLAVAAHELKTPLTALRLASQLGRVQIERGRTPDLAQMVRMMERVEMQSRKLTDLVGKLLDVSRIESGRLLLDRQAVDLVPIVQGAVEASRANDLRRQLSVTTPATLVVEVDPLRIEQVIVNLVDNAIRHGDGEIEVALTEPSPEQVQLTVRDHGPGIPEEMRAHVFERFYQAHVHQGGGMGIGLFVSRQIAELHGGSLTVDAPPGGGSRFVLALPGVASPHSHSGDTVRVVG